MLSVQDLLNLGHVAWGESDRPHRAVARHAEALADADDVALGRALQPVAAGDDADVVAAQAEVLVQETDMLVHTARKRIHVRSDESDLHADRSSVPRRRAFAAWYSASCCSCSVS